MDKKVILWAKNEKLSSVVPIGVQEGRLYKSPENSTQALVHNTVDPCELWHRRFGHLHYTALPGFQKMVTGMPEISPKHDGVCKGCPCYPLICTIVGLAEEPPVDKHDKCLFPVYQMIRLCV